MIHIDPATPSDLDIIRLIHTRSWRDAYARFVPDAALARLEDEMAARWATLPDGVLCARGEKGISGFVRLKIRQGWPYIDNLHTDPERRGNGIGVKLMEAAGRWLEDRGDGRVWLTVIEGNTRARAFYIRCGGYEGAAMREAVLGHTLRTRPVIWNTLGPMVSKN